MITCPLCKGKNQDLVYLSNLDASKPTLNQYVCTTSSYGLHGPIYRCIECSFVFIADETSDNDILISYENVEDALYIGEEAGRIKTFTHHLKRIEKICRKGKLLDIGSYTGLFLSIAKNRGWQVEGIEPSRWAVKQAKNMYGIVLKQGPIKLGYFPKDSFDVITVWDAIEHFANPLQALKTCHSYLKPGGCLFMSTMDIGSFAARILGSKWPWLMHMHRVYFSKKTMKKMLIKAGFTNIQFRPHIRYVSARYLISKLTHSKPISHPLGNILIPFYVGDLFEVYAKKLKL